MDDIISALGDAVLSYLREQKQEGRVATLQEAADKIELILTPEQMVGLKLARDGVAYVSFMEHPPTFQGIPMYEAYPYDGPMIRPRGYYNALRHS